jgi:hypothetical protein
VLARFDLSGTEPPRAGVADLIFQLEPTLRLAGDLCSGTCFLGHSWLASVRGNRPTQPLCIASSVLLVARSIVVIWLTIVAGPIKETHSATLRQLKLETNSARLAASLW